MSHPVNTPGAVETVDSSIQHQCSGLMCSGPTRLELAYFELAITRQRDYRLIVPVPLRGLNRRSTLKPLRRERGTTPWSSFLKILFDEDSYSYRSFQLRNLGRDRFSLSSSAA